MVKLHTSLALGIALIASPLAAQEQPAEQAANQAVAAETKTQGPASPFGAAEPVEERNLAAIAGREDINQLTNAEQANAVTGNEVGDNSVTGQINISDRAFSNTNGFVVLNANTGNNVAINASIQVNVALPVQTAPTQ